MKIIVISALAFGLTAFAARAQQSSVDDPNKGTSPSTSTAQPGTPAAGVEVRKSKKQRGQARSSTSVRHRPRSMPQSSSSKDVPPSSERENNK